jgi:hypothetical protein
MIAKLTDPWFEAEFYGNVGKSGLGRDSWQRQDGIDGAQGIVLWCPCGYGKPEFPLDGARPHALIIPFANPRNAPPVPPDHGPVSMDGSHRPRWQMSGTGLADLTLTPSVNVGNPSCWHGFITNGIVS